MGARDTELNELRYLCERLKQEAINHAQEARTANATIRKIYQAVTGASGEPGSWNGAVPVKAELDHLRSRLAAAEMAIEPFAALANEIFRVEDGREMNATKPDDHAVWGYDRVLLTTGHLRAARAWMEGK